MVKKDEATVTSVSIEVKVIRVGKRQMTLAVFDQLPNGTKEALDNGIFGNPWGKVQRKGEWYVITEHQGQLWKINLSGMISSMVRQSQNDQYIIQKRLGDATTLSGRIKDILNRNTKVEQLQDMIDSLPQLFIAV